MLSNEDPPPKKRGGTFLQADVRVRVRVRVRVCVCAGRGGETDLVVVFTKLVLDGKVLRRQSVDCCQQLQRAHGAGIVGHITRQGK